MMTHKPCKNGLNSKCAKYSQIDEWQNRVRIKRHDSWITGEMNWWIKWFRNRHLQWALKVVTLQNSAVKFS